MALLPSTGSAWRVRALLGSAAYVALLQLIDEHQDAWAHEDERIMLDQGASGLYPLTISLALAWAERRASEELIP